MFASASAFLVAMQAAAKSDVIRGMYFQKWSSEMLMQTVSVADLREQPLRSLFYLHIQPPLFDALRAVLARFHAGATEWELVRMVDADLYRLWALAYGALCALVYLWLARLTSDGPALALVALFAIHPAAIGYAALLDTTILGAGLVTWVLFELWCWHQGRGSEIRLVSGVVLLYLTRSLLQWPFLPALVLALWASRAPWPRIARVIGAIVLVMAVYTVKQYALFGLTVTSSLAPENLCRGLGRRCKGDLPAVELPAFPPPSAARVLSRREKFGGRYNYNQLEALRYSFEQMAEYRRLLRTVPPTEIAQAWWTSLQIWFQPSSAYEESAGRNVLVDRLGWRPAYDRVCSGLPLAGLLFAAAVLSLTRAGPEWPRRLGMASPALYVFAVTIVFEQGENNRYKFFLEPALYVWVISEAYTLYSSRRIRRAPIGRDTPLTAQPLTFPGESCRRLSS